MSKKLSWEEVHRDKDNIEIKRYEAYARLPRAILIRCPFCNAKVTAYMWSLAGTGKRCDCGALFSRWGNVYKRKSEVSK